jgi:DNA polymerase III delta prime subunit
MMCKFFLCALHFKNYYQSQLTRLSSYAPVLRPLRIIAESIVFKKVPMMSIAKRLQDICDMEGLDSDLRTLSMLSETTDGDIRSCLNTLQVKSRNSHEKFVEESLKSCQCHYSLLGERVQCLRRTCCRQLV